ncbi:MAG: hypothetical protein AAF389_02010 [Gemmatimonadota bacterium]
MRSAARVTDGPPSRIGWLPPFLVAAAAAVATEVAVSILLYGGAAFVRSLTTILATAGVGFGVGLWSVASADDQLVDRLRRRWVFALVAFLLAAVFGSAWSLYEPLGSARWGQGAGLALLAALPLYASGAVLGGIAVAARTDPGGRLSSPAAAAAVGATVGIVVTGYLLPRAPMPASLLVGCVVLLSLGGMIFGGVLGVRTEVEEVARRPGRPSDVVVQEVRRAVDDLAIRELLEGEQLRRSMPLEESRSAPWDVAATRILLPDLDTPARFVFVGSGPSSAPHAAIREHPLVVVDVLERTAATVELGREWFSTELRIGSGDRLRVSGGNLDDSIESLEAGFDVLVVDTRGIGPIGGVYGLSARSREALVRKLSPGGLVVWGPGAPEVGEPEKPDGWSSASYVRGAGTLEDEYLTFVRESADGDWPDGFDGFASR